MGIGENIKRFRKMNDLKQTELGKMLNVSGNTISSWEVNRTEPNIGMIEKMCEIFKCTKSELLEPYPTIITANERQTAKILKYAELIMELSPENREHIIDFIEYMRLKEKKTDAKS